MKYYACVSSVTLQSTVEFTRPVQTGAYNGKDEPIIGNEKKKEEGLLLIEKNACFAYDEQNDFGSINLQTAGIAGMVYLSDEGRRKVELNKAIYLNGRDPFDKQRQYMALTKEQYNELCKCADDIIIAKNEGADCKEKLDEYNNIFERIKEENGIKKDKSDSRSEVERD